MPKSENATGRDTLEEGKMPRLKLTEASFKDLL
ncbi:uncharacterized protein G2W53_027178 [Senna tora]|uniref:Uncharacterized protein n=1 Tax=Senna tora TaxID=362788 RepID=A0A834TGL7_9FABA|nr:uncharacterized protein G2W53_027178 [Senna tora]